MEDLVFIYDAKEWIKMSVSSEQIDDNAIIITKNLTKKFILKTKSSKFRYLLKFAPREAINESILAVNKVNVKIYKGEIFGLIGPNGAGKTTFLKLLCGLLIPTAGTAIVDNKDIRVVGHKICQTSIAVLFSTQITWPRLSAKMILRIDGKLFGMPRRDLDKKIDEILHTVGLDRFASEWPIKFSTGMQRKLMLARCLLRDVPIMLLDEPTVHLDPASSKEIRDLIKRLSKEQKKTIIYTTHNMYDAEYCCDRIAFMNHGKIIKVDTPENLKKDIVKNEILDFSLTNCSERLISQLKEINGISRIEYKYEDPSFIKLTLNVDKKGELLYEIIDLILKTGGKILSINKRGVTLDDVFIELSKKNRK